MMAGNLWMPCISLAVLVLIWRLPAAAGLPIHDGRPVIDERKRLVLVPAEVRQQAVFMAIGIGEYLSVTQTPAQITTSNSPENQALVDSSFLRRALPDVTDIRLRLSSDEEGPANLETLLAHPPDVLVTWRRLAEGFERIGLAVVALGPVSSSERLLEHTRIFADIVGKPQRATEIIERARDAGRRTKLQVAELTRGMPRVLYVVARGAGRWQIVGGMAELLAAAHAVDMGEQAREGAQLDAERLLALAPDVVLIGGNISDDIPHQLMLTPALAALPAVVSRRVYRTPPGFTNYMMSVIELPIYARWLAEVLHPDELPAEVRSLARDVYSAGFGAVPTDAELDYALAGRANQHSAYPERFGRTVF